MKNKERYAKELVEYAIAAGFAIDKDNTIISCDGEELDPRDCNLYDLKYGCCGCHSRRADWANSEYIPPLPTPGDKVLAYDSGVGKWPAVYIGYVDGIHYARRNRYDYAETWEHVEVIEEE